MGAGGAGVRVSRVGPEGTTVQWRSSTSVAMADPLVDASFWMTDMDLDELAAGTVQNGQLLHVELLFSPRPGYTPLDPTSTNLSIRYIVVSRGEVGVYEGGGFGYPIGSIDDPSMRVGIERASLTLGPHTSGFLDLLTPATLAGAATASSFAPPSAQTGRPPWADRAPRRGRRRPAC